MVLRPLAEHLADGTGGMGQVELLIIGSEPPTGPDLRQLRALLPPAARTLSAFGLTEVTVDSTYYPHGDGDLDSAGPLPIGRPLPGTRLQVVDPQFRLVPPGVLGELVLAGPGLSRGYAGRPDLTAQRFVASPFASDGSRLYRTGDLVRWRAGQTLEFHGRTDEQLRIRGHRIEPGEVEARLRTLPGVAAAAVAAHGEHLVGYLVAPSGRAAPDLAQLRAHLSAALPAAMIPSRLVSLDALPLTATGKLDRARLPPPGEQPPTGPRTAPATPAEEALRDIWADVLGHEVGVTDNFFAAGGHSLLAARVMARIGRAFGVSLGLRHIFDTPTIRQLAAVIEQTVLAEISQLSDDQVRQLLARDGGAEPPRKADGR